MDTLGLLRRIGTTVRATDPNAILILFGLYARGEQHKNSDIDLLILLDQDILTRADHKRLKYPLYELEFETGTVISPMVFLKKDWETRHKKIPFYENVANEGRPL